MAALQIEQMAAIVHYRNDDFPFVGARFSFGGGCHAFGIFQREDRFAGHGHLPSARKTWSRMASTLPTPGMCMILGAFRSPDLAQAV